MLTVHVKRTGGECCHGQVSAKEIPSMEKDTSSRVPRKKPPAGQAVVVALLALHGIVLIIIGLIAFFGGFVGAYEVSNGHATPEAKVAVLGAFLAWIFLLGGIVSF
jgi:hypothetical protein